MFIFPVLRTNQYLMKEFCPSSIRVLNYLLHGVMFIFPKPQNPESTFAGQNDPHFLYNKKKEAYSLHLVMRKAYRPLPARGGYAMRVRPLLLF